jgi:hypothetical protein
MQPCRYEFPYFFPMHDCHALGLNQDSYPPIKVGCESLMQLVHAKSWLVPHLRGLGRCCQKPRTFKCLMQTGEEACDYVD